MGLPYNVLAYNLSSEGKMRYLNTRQPSLMRVVAIIKYLALYVGEETEFRAASEKAIRISRVLKGLRTF